ncbi:MAG: ATP-binding protein, partial [Candidatus Dormibacteraceae bacterium]
YNPWWQNPGWPAVDEELLALQSSPVRLPTPLIDDWNLIDPGLSTIRGPRQVGKSTLLKLLARRAMEEGRRAGQVIYLTLDLLRGRPLTELDAAVARAKELSGATKGALVLLDEVTIVEGWDIGVKEMWDSGLLRGDIVICTGSSASDLLEGAVERWPGRRGGGDDYLVLPQGFASFAQVLDSTVPTSPALSVGQLLEPRGQQLLLEARVFETSLRLSFERYLRFGGLPIAVAEAVAGRALPSRRTTRVFSDSLAREVVRRGFSEPGTYALLERIARSLGSMVNWSAMGQEMDVPLNENLRRDGATSGQTVRKYVERLAATYFSLIVYAWKSDLVGNDLAREKKLYFGDPLLYSMIREVAGGPPEDVPALVENVIALTLYRHYEPEYAQLYGFAMPTRLHFWRSKRGTEVDFLAGPRSNFDAVEIKFQRRIDRRHLTGMLRAFPGRPVVIATQDELVLGDNSALIPAHLLAWALG